MNARIFDGNPLLQDSILIRSSAVWIREVEQAFQFGAGFLENCEGRCMAAPSFLRWGEGKSSKNLCAA
jgi:hypothetical protein